MMARIFFKKFLNFVLTYFNVRSMLFVSRKKYKEEMMGAKNDISELDRLEAFLLANKYHYTRIDENVGYLGHDRHQIIVYNDKHERLWDAVCHFGSYGHSQGLLEIMGCIVRGRDSVEGWLTADDVIKRFKEWEDVWKR